MSTERNYRTKKRLGALEQRFLSYAQMKKLAVVRFGQLRNVLELNDEQERKILFRLARGGTIVRMKRGVYLVPAQLPLGGVWNPGEPTILRELMRTYKNGRCQLCGLAVFNRYGFTEQVAARASVYNNRIYGNRSIGGREFIFIKVPDRRLGGTLVGKGTDEMDGLMPSKSRALVDAVVEWSRFGTLPKAFGWIRGSVEKDPAIAGRVVEAACCFGNQGAIRRIGFVLDSIGLTDAQRRRLKKALRSSTSVIPLVPGRPARGRLWAEWGVIDNE